MKVALPYEMPEERVKKAIEYCKKHKIAPPYVDEFEELIKKGRRGDVSGRTFGFVKKLNNRFPLGFTLEELIIIGRAILHDSSTDIASPNKRRAG